MPDGKELQEDARKRLKHAEEAWATGDFAETYFESQRALRPVRILMRAPWQKAVRELESPVASPYAVSFFTLPKHWEYRDKILKAQAMENVLPGGDFEDGPDQAPGKWLPQEVTTDDMELAAWRMLGTPKDKDKDDKDDKDKKDDRKDRAPSVPPPGVEKPANTVRGQMPQAGEWQPANGRDAGGNPLPPGPRSTGDAKTPIDPKKKKQLPPEPPAKSGQRMLKLQIKQKVDDKDKDKEEDDDDTADDTDKSKGPADPTKPSLQKPPKPEKPKKPLPPALKHTFLAINSPTVKLPPGTIVRITGWVMIPGSIASSVDGALFYDSVGGEPLAFRLVDGTSNKWRKLTLYRIIPASGSISVTLTLTGIGTVYFDDVRIEPLQLNASPAAYHGWTRGGEQRTEAERPRQ